MLAVGQVFQHIAGACVEAKHAKVRLARQQLSQPIAKRGAAVDNGHVRLVAQLTSSADPVMLEGRTRDIARLLTDDLHVAHGSGCLGGVP